MRGLFLSALAFFSVSAVSQETIKIGVITDRVGEGFLHQFVKPRRGSLMVDRPLFNEGAPFDVVNEKSSGTFLDFWIEQFCPTRKGSVLARGGMILHLFEETELGH